MALTFETFSKVNLARCEAADGFNHPLGGWSLSDWMTATMGELGEAANVIKKLNRCRDGIRGNNKSEAALREQLKREIADAFIYLDLMAQAAGFSLGDAVAVTFDEKSLAIGYPHMVGGINGAFSIGDVVRYGGGPTALFQITSWNGDRAYGNHVLGGAASGHRDDLRLASLGDMETWRAKMAEARAAEAATE